MFTVFPAFTGCKICHQPIRDVIGNETVNGAYVTPLPRGATETTTCIEYCSQVVKVEMLGGRVAEGFIPDLCAGQEVLTKLTDVIILADVIEGFKSAIGVAVLLSTIVTLAPASLSLVLGIVKAGMVLKASLPWVRLPSFQIVVSTSILLPLIVSIMAGIFQVAADLYSLGFSICIVCSFLHNWPTRWYLTAKSYKDTIAEIGKRSYFQQIFLIGAIAFVVVWITTSERLREVLLESNFVDLRNVLSVDRPNTAIWTLVQIVLDFLGKSVLSKLFFTDLLLLMTVSTELAEPSPHQRVMRDQTKVLYDMSRMSAGDTASEVDAAEVEVETQSHVGASCASDEPAELERSTTVEIEVSKSKSGEADAPPPPPLRVSTESV